jgi:hypothetical protein
MIDKMKNGISYAAVGIACATLGSLLSLRIYAGLPERQDKIERRVESLEIFVRDAVIEMKGDIREIKTIMENRQ